MNKIFKVFSRALAAATEIPRDTFVAVAQVQIDVPTRFIVVREHFHLHRRVVSSPRDKFRPSLHHSSEDSGRETECGSRGGDSEFLPWGLVAKESARDQGPLWSSRTSRTSEEARLHCCAGLLRCCVRLSFLVDPTPGGCAGGTSAARHGAATSVHKEWATLRRLCFECKQGCGEPQENMIVSSEVAKRKDTTSIVDRYLVDERYGVCVLSGGIFEGT